MTFRETLVRRRRSELRSAGVYAASAACMAAAAVPSAGGVMAVWICGAVLAAVAAGMCAWYARKLTKGIRVYDANPAAAYLVEIRHAFGDDS